MTETVVIPADLTESEVRCIVRFRDGFCCTECGMTHEEHVAKYGKKLDVHRLDPGSQYTVDGCVTLCRRCHGPKPRRPRGSCSRRWHYINLKLGPNLWAALKTAAIRDDRKMSQMAIILVKQALAARGFWPPPDAADGLKE